MQAPSWLKIHKTYNVGDHQAESVITHSAEAIMVMFQGPGITWDGAVQGGLMHYCFSQYVRTQQGHTERATMYGSSLYCIQLCPNLCH